jgi:hypothetical protein
MGGDHMGGVIMDRERERVFLPPDERVMFNFD